MGVIKPRAEESIGQRKVCLGCDGIKTSLLELQDEMMGEKSVTMLKTSNVMKLNVGLSSRSNSRMKHSLTFPVSRAFLRHSTSCIYYLMCDRRCADHWTEQKETRFLRSR